MKTKKIFIIVMTLVLAYLSTVSISANNIQFDQYPYYVQLIIDYSNLGEVIQTHDLYDTSNVVIATCLDFENAYIIYDNNGAIVECSESSKSKYYNINEKAYYGGALNYFVKKDYNYYDLSKGNIVDADNFAKLVKKFKSHTSKRKIEIEKKANSIQPLSGSQTPTIESFSLRTPRAFNWNNDNTCGSLAATIILDHMNTSRKIQLSFLYENNPKILYESLKYYCELNYAQTGEGGSSHESLVSGFNKFTDILNLGTVAMDACFQITYGGSDKYIFYINRLKNGVPCFVGIPGHMTVGYGGRKIYAPNGELVLSQFLINNGWGDNGILIDTEEVDGLIVVQKPNCYK